MEMAKIWKMVVLYGGTGDDVERRQGRPKGYGGGIQDAARRTI